MSVGASREEGQRVATGGPTDDRRDRATGAVAAATPVPAPTSGPTDEPRAPSSGDPRDPATLEERLRAAGHRVTDARRCVHDALAEADGHLTPEDVVAHGDDAANLATVYRVLGLFEELGLARSTRLGSDASASWELAHPDDHVHLVCRRCGDVDHHVGDAVSRLRGHLVQGHGFSADEVDLVVRGTCAACRGVLDQVVPPSLPADEASASPSSPDHAPRDHGPAASRPPSAPARQTEEVA